VEGWGVEGKEVVAMVVVKAADVAEAMEVEVTVVGKVAVMVVS
jgi:hypothetical protein